MRVNYALTVHRRIHSKEKLRHSLCKINSAYFEGQQLKLTPVALPNGHYLYIITDQVPVS